MDKVQTIERSLRCFWFSVFGLIPVFGLPLAVHSFFSSQKLRRETRAQWNPARPYLNWSTALGCLGILLTVLTLVAICLIIIDNYSNGSWSNSSD